MQRLLLTLLGEAQHLLAPLHGRDQANLKICAVPLSQCPAFPPEATARLEHTGSLSHSTQDPAWGGQGAAVRVTASRPVTSSIRRHKGTPGGLCGAIGQRVRLLTERLVVRAHPGTGSSFSAFGLELLGFVKCFPTVILQRGHLTSAP